MNMMNMNNSSNNDPNKINIQFKAITNVNYNLICNKGVTMSEVFKEYLARINKEILYEDNNIYIQLELIFYYFLIQFNI